MKKSKQGFTLVELLAVITIIGILAALVLGVSSYATRKASESRAIADMEKFRNALEEYKIEYGAYPGDPSKGEVAISTFNDPEWTLEDDFKPLTNFVYDVALEDPWGNSYFYEKTSEFQYVLRSLGQNTNDTPEGAADDLDSSKGYK